MPRRFIATALVAVAALFASPANAGEETLALSGQRLAIAAAMANNMATVPAVASGADKGLVPVKAMSPALRAQVEALIASSAGKKLTREEECLAFALYQEARGETLDGQYAVAEAILTRVEQGGFKNTICGVVYEKLPKPSNGQEHQFQFVDMPAPPPSSSVEIEVNHTLRRMAQGMVRAGKNRPVFLGPMEFFHATNLSSTWVGGQAKKNNMVATYVVGNHVFYSRTSTLEEAGVQLAYLPPTPAPTPPAPQRKPLPPFGYQQVAGVRG